MRCVGRLVPLCAVCLAVLTGCAGDASPMIALGPTEHVIDETIGTAGGTITVHDADSTLDQLAIEVPAGAFAEETPFSISVQPITSHNLGEAFNPLTGLIAVQNGGAYAADVMRMTIPVAVPEGHFAGAFYYDEQTGELEALPVIDLQSDAITVATRHFSKLVVSSAPYDLLLGDIDTGFKMPDDWWQFENLGTYLSPGGICSGMSVTALFYYDVLKKTRGALHGRYDNNGNDPKSPGFSLDDSHAIKLAATAQSFEEHYTGHEHDWWYKTGETKGPIWSFYMASYAMLLSGRPQYVSIFTANTGEAGHALVAYRKSGRDLFVADPNLPLDSDPYIRVDLDEGTMENYKSRWNVGTEIITFSKLFFLGRTAIVDYTSLADLWATIDDADKVSAEFPDHTVYVRSATASDENTLADKNSIDGAIAEFRVSGEFDWRVDIYNATDLGQVEGTENQPTRVTLSDGDNRIGVHVLAKRHSDVTQQDEWVWVDFRWVTVTATKDTSVACIAAPSVWAFTTYEYKSGCSYLTYDDIDWSKKTQLTLSADGTIVKDGEKTGTWSASYDSHNDAKRLSLDFDATDVAYLGALSADCNDVGGMTSEPPLGGIGLPKTGCWKARRQ